MAKIYVGNTGYKLNLGSNKIKRGYIGNILVYSGDVGITYHVDDSAGLQYNEIVEEGYSCLSPKSFNPVGLKPGYTFLGWRSDTVPSENVYTELIAGSEPIDLYAVYYIDYQINFYNASTTPVSKLYRAYYNNGNDAFPSTETGDLTMNTVSGFENAVGWTDTAGSYSQLYNNNGVVDNIHSNMNLYSIYSKNVSVKIVNGSNDGAVKSTVSNVIYRQYNSTEIKTKNPTINLTHNYINDWVIDKWGTVLNNSSRDIDDGPFEISQEYNGKTLYAFYTKHITGTIVNGSDISPVISYISDDKVRQFTAVDTGYKDFNPVISLTHNAVTGFNSSGWNTTRGNYSSVYSDGNVTVTEDALTFYALYSKAVKVTVYNGYNYVSGDTYSPVSSVNQLTRYRQYNTTTYTDKNPSITLTHSTVTGWTKNGWNITRSNREPISGVGDGTFTVTSDYDGKSIYALYKKNVKLTYYNGVVIGNTYTPSKTTETVESVAQFNNTAYYRYNPTVVLTHNSVSEWTNAGWSISTNKGVKLANDGNFTVSETYNGATLYALYTKGISITLINATSDGVAAEKIVSGNVKIEYRSDYGYYNPSTTLKQVAMSGWNTRGWTWYTDSIDTSSTVSDGSFTFTLSMDGKKLCSSYRKKVTVTWYADNNSGTAEAKWYYKRAISKYPQYFEELLPSYKRAIASKSGWIVDGWCTSNTAGVSKQYNSNQQFTTYQNLSLYAQYYNYITLNCWAKGERYYYNENIKCYYNNGSTFYPQVWVPAPEAPSGKTFLGWATNGERPEDYTGWPFTFTSGAGGTFTYYAHWKNADRVLINNPDPGNTYTCPFNSGVSRLVTATVGTVSYNDYESISNIKISTTLSPGEWAIATNSYQRLFPGTTPKDFTQTGGDINNQPSNRLLRFINLQHGQIKTDDGPCAGNVTVELTNIALYETGTGSGTSTITLAFLGDMYSGTITIYYLKLTGRKILW